MKHYKCTKSIENYISGHIYGENYKPNGARYNCAIMATTNPDRFEEYKWNLKTMPEKFCVYAKYLKFDEENFLKTSLGELIGRNVGGHSYFHYPEISEGVCTSPEIHPGYSEISFEMFKQYMEDLRNTKPIIGYIIKSDCIDYLKTAAKICDVDVDKWNESIKINNYQFSKDSISAKLLEKYNVLDLWFRTVKSDEPILPIINGIHGEFVGGCFKYGTTILEVSMIETMLKYSRTYGLCSLKFNNNFEIKFNQLNELQKYYNYFNK